LVNSDAKSQIPAKVTGTILRSFGVNHPNGDKDDIFELSKK